MGGWPPQTVLELLKPWRGPGQEALTVDHCPLLHAGPIMASVRTVHVRKPPFKLTGTHTLGKSVTLSAGTYVFRYPLHTVPHPTIPHEARASGQDHDKESAREPPPHP